MDFFCKLLKTEEQKNGRPWWTIFSNISEFRNLLRLLLDTLGTKRQIGVTEIPVYCELSATVHEKLCFSSLALNCRYALNLFPKKVEAKCE